MVAFEALPLEAVKVVVLAVPLVGLIDGCVMKTGAGVGVGFVVPSPRKGTFTISNVGKAPGVAPAFISTRTAISPISLSASVGTKAADFWTISDPVAMTLRPSFKRRATSTASWRAVG